MKPEPLKGKLTRSVKVLVFNDVATKEDIRSAVKWKQKFDYLAFEAFAKMHITLAELQGLLYIFDDEAFEDVMK